MIRRTNAGTLEPRGRRPKCFIVSWKFPRRAALFLVLFAAFSSAMPSYAQSQPKTHSITVRFNYDFTSLHACPVKGPASCLKQFNVYNLTDTGRRILLFSIPVPVGAKALVTGISGTSKSLVFTPGEHMIAVTAMTNQGMESNPRACATMVNIAP